MFVHRRDGEPIALRRPVGGLARRRPPTRPGCSSCAIVTTRANAVMAPIHDRMPVMLPEAAWETWLDSASTTARELEPLLVPAPDDGDRALAGEHDGEQRGQQRTRARRPGRARRAGARTRCSRRLRVDGPRRLSSPSSPSSHARWPTRRASWIPTRACRRVRSGMSRSSSATPAPRTDGRRASCGRAEALSPKSIDLEIPRRPRRAPRLARAWRGRAGRPRWPTPIPTHACWTWTDDSHVALLVAPDGARDRGPPLGRPGAHAARPTPFDGALAVDGIDEHLENLPFIVGPRADAPGSGETLHLHCTDRDGEWLLRLGAGRPRGDPRARQGRRRAAGPGVRSVPRGPRPAVPPRQRRGLRRPGRARAAGSRSLQLLGSALGLEGVAEDVEDVLPAGLERLGRERVPVEQARR